VRIAIVGGGIGGLTAGLALRRAGFDATVYERADEPADAGTGLTLWTNAITALDQLGVADDVVAAGPVLGHFENMTHDGRHLATWPVGAMSLPLGAPNVTVLRGDLHAVLRRALGPGALRLGRRCLAATASGEVRFADGSVEGADVVVGADGVNSVVRSSVLGPSRPAYAGYVVWRGLADVPETLVPAGVHRQLWGRGARFGFYRAGPARRLYWWATTGVPERDPRQTATEHLPYLRELFGGWPLADEVLAGTAESEVLLSRVYHGPPLRHWGRGRVTLLGDAAHAMTFNVGQGACQAIEDGVVLARMLARGRPEEALREYEAVRSARTAPLVARARRIGRLGLVRGRAGCAGRDAALRVLLNGPAFARHVADMQFP
jgi:2-polyprenyl-6-methoxyphenol hydroxylase-like FAD-dependent oxidoreductase